jgi:hypothetical protein
MSAVGAGTSIIPRGRFGRTRPPSKQRSPRVLKHRPGEFLQELCSDHCSHVDEISRRVQLDDVGADDRSGQRIDDVEHLTEGEPSRLVMRHASGCASM